MMALIVGLDLSLVRTGIAVLSTLPPAVKVCGDVAPVLLRSVGEDGTRADSYQVRSRRVRRQCTAVMGILGKLGDDIVLAVVEGPIYGMKVLPSYFDRAGLWHGVYGALDAARIPVAVVSPTTSHQFMTGRAHAEKAALVEETSTWWPQPRGPLRVDNHDEADALGLAVMGAMHLRMTLPFRPRRRHHNAVHAVEWPKLRG